MPPEQVSGDINSTGPASDIYSLGIIFYELLTGRLPFHGDAMAMLSQVLMDEPPHPSSLRPGLEPELEAICLKAMAKKIEDRYALMAEFAAALTDALRARPAGAQPTAGPLPKPTVSPKTKSGPMSIHVSQMGGTRSVAMLFNQPPAAKAESDKPRRRPKRAGRRRIPAWAWLVGAGGGVALLLAVLWAVGVFRVNTKDGVYEVEVNEPNADVFVDGEKTTVTWNNGGKQAEIRLRPGTHKVEVKKDGVTVSGEDVAVEEGGKISITARFKGPAEAKEAPEKRLLHLKESAPDRGEEIRQIHWEGSGRGRIFTAHFSPDDRRCLISGDNDLTLLYDVQTGQPVGPRMKGYISVYMPGGKEILAGLWAKSTFHVYDLDGKAAREFHGKDDLSTFALSPRGDRLLTVSSGVHRLVDVNDGREMKKWSCDTDETFVFFSPDGQYLFRLVDGKVPWQAFRTNNGEQVKAFENIAGINSLRGFFPDGQRVFGRDAGGVQVYDVSSGKKVEELALGQSPAAAVTLSPDGKRFLAAHVDQHVRLWDAASGRELSSFSVSNVPKVHHMSLNFSADGQYACAGGTPGWVYVWRLPQP
jgi:WD40 repeat protein